MREKPESRKSERFGHHYIVKLGGGRKVSPLYAVSYNLSATGMYLKSLFELRPGARFFFSINDYISIRNQVPGKVVWCEKLENGSAFRYGAGVEFLPSIDNYDINASFPVSPRSQAQRVHENVVGTQMESRASG